MAIAYVRQLDKSNSNTLSVPAAGCAQGNTVVISVITNGGTDVLSGVTDSKGNTYVIDKTVSGVPGTAIVVHGYLTTALVLTDTLTIAWSSGPGSRMSGAHEFSGISSASPTDQTISATNNGTSSVLSTLTSALTGSTDLYFASIRTSQSGLTDVTSGLTSLGDDFSQYHVRYKILAASTAVDYQGTVAGGNGWSVALATYLAAAAPANTVAPVASGSTTVGSVVSTTNGTWTGAPAPTFTYQWQRDVLGNGIYTNIAAATSSSYTLVLLDDGNDVRCVVTGTNVSGSASANSNSILDTTPVPSSGGRSGLLLLGAG